MSGLKPDWKLGLDDNIVKQLSVGILFCFKTLIFCVYWISSSKQQVVINWTVLKSY